VVASIALSVINLWGLLIAVPVIIAAAFGIKDVTQSRHAILRNYPVIGHGRYLAERLRPELLQYFVESDIDGRPFPREVRSLVYQRSKGDLDKIPFGAQTDVYEPGFEFIVQSLVPNEPPSISPRISIGGPGCSQPYDSSFLNVSAMSYGSLSANAVSAMNKGAKSAHFAQNTGEGGIAPCHLENGGDLIWQLGTGYFGARAPDGNFDPDEYVRNAARPEVKMIELKLSQGAKPGHGGILPAGKVTKEISEIRGVPMGQDVLSPPGHMTFSTPIGLCEFIDQLRSGSGGKPVGFKLCVGNPGEFLAIGKAMVETGITPDFISLDGSEGGTGAAPFEFINGVGMPMREGLNFVNSTLVWLGLRDRVSLIAAGKIATGFDMFMASALGADACAAARPMMMAVGCIQTLRCHSNDCPVGVATQNASLMGALDVDDKAQRIASYHSKTVKAFDHLIGAAGLDHPSEIRAHHVQRRIDETSIAPLSQFYGRLSPGVLLDGGTDAPQQWRAYLQSSSAATFVQV
jgi:glutamate synthase domain-containing protein 2